MAAGRLEATVNPARSIWRRELERPSAGGAAVYNGMRMGSEKPGGVGGGRPVEPADNIRVEGASSMRKDVEVPGSAICTPTDSSLSCRGSIGQGACRGTTVYRTARPTGDGMLTSSGQVVRRASAVAVGRGAATNNGDRVGVDRISLHLDREGVRTGGSRRTVRRGAGGVVSRFPAGGVYPRPRRPTSGFPDRRAWSRRAPWSRRSGRISTWRSPTGPGRCPAGARR